MISEGSYDKKTGVMITGINYILKYIKIGNEY